MNLSNALHHRYSGSYEVRKKQAAAFCSMKRWLKDDVLRALVNVLLYRQSRGDIGHGLSQQK